MIKLIPAGCLLFVDVYYLNECNNFTVSRTGGVEPLCVFSSNATARTCRHDRSVSMRVWGIVDCNVGIRRGRSHVPFDGAPFFC